MCGCVRAEADLPRGLETGDIRDPALAALAAAADAEARQRMAANKGHEEEHIPEGH